MITFDTLKFNFPLSLVKSYKKNSFEFLTRTQNNIAVLSKKAVCQQPFTGLSDISIDFFGNRINMTVSAKILQRQYLDGIHKNNLENVLEIINKNGIVKFKTSDVIDALNFYRVDCTKNIQCFGDLQNYINALTFAVNSKKYNFQNYRNQSVTFCKNPTSKRRRLRFIFYDKYKEIKRDKKFCEVVPPELFMDVLRFEITLNNYFLMRKYLNVKVKEPLNFNNIICSRQNIFQNIFIDLFSTSEISKRFDPVNTERKKLSEIEKELGANVICESLNYDYKKVSLFLRSNVKGNISRYFNRYRGICIAKNNIDNSINTQLYLNKIYSKVA